MDAGVPWDRLIVDPGFGFGKTPDHNLALLAGLGALRVLGRPILLGTSRKSTLGKVLDLPPDQRVEATAATTALGIAAGARTSSASTTCARTSARRASPMRSCAAGGPAGGWREPRRVSDRILLEGMVFEGTHGVYPEEQVTPQPFEVDVELALNLQPAGLSDDLALTVDYARVFDACRQIVESTRFNLIEALAEAIAQELLAGFPVVEVTVRIRKPKVQLGGTVPQRRASRSGAAASPDDRHGGRHDRAVPGPPDGAPVARLADARRRVLEVVGPRPERHAAR